MKDAFEAIMAIAAAVVGLAVVAVLVSKQSNTAGVIQGASSGFASIIGAAVAPVGSGGSPFGGSSTSSNLFGGVY